MKTTKLFFMAALALMTAACSNDDNDLTPQQPQKAKGITITATLAPKTGGADTRAVSEGTNKIVAEWDENEHLAVLYTVGSTKYAADATITAVDDGGAATIEFTVEGGTANNTPCTLVYPAKLTDGTTTVYKDDHTGVKDAATLLAAQDGRLSANLDVRVGAGTIQTTTPGLTVTTQPEAQFAIFKFTTMSVPGEYGSLEETNVKKLTVTIGAQNYVIKPASATSTLYAALPAVDNQTVSFTATNGSNLYAASKASVSFAAAKYYQSTVKMGKVIQVQKEDDPNIADLFLNSYTYKYLHIGLAQAYAIAKQLSTLNSGAKVAVVYDNDNNDNYEVTYALSSDDSATAHQKDYHELFDEDTERVFLATLWED